MKISLTSAISLAAISLIIGSLPMTRDSALADTLVVAGDGSTFAYRYRSAARRKPLAKAAGSPGCTWLCDNVGR